MTLDSQNPEGVKIEDVFRIKLAIGPESKGVYSKAMKSTKVSELFEGLDSEKIE